MRKLACNNMHVDTYLKLAMVCNRLHTVSRTCAFASCQVMLASDVHQFVMLSFGCFLPIVQRHSTVSRKAGPLQAAARDFTPRESYFCLAAE